MSLLLLFTPSLESAPIESPSVAAVPEGTTNTVGTTVFDLQKIIDSAYRWCKLSPQQITSEMIDAAKDHLYLMLSSLANTSTPRWCLDEAIYPLYEGVSDVFLGVGSIDARNVNLRDLQRITATASSTSGTAANANDGDIETRCTLAAVDGEIVMDLGVADTPSTFGILPGATGTWAFTIEYSSDGVTYTVAHTEAAYAAVDRAWYWVDVQGLPARRYWRLNAGATTTLDVREFFLGKNPREVPLGRINTDDHYGLANRTTKGRPTQYRMDRRRVGPYLKLWPAPDASTTYRQIVALVHRHVMDIGAMTQEVEVPQRWYDAIVLVLASRLAATTPEVKDEALIERVEKRATTALALAWAEERDSSPTRVSLGIGAYTRS